MIFLSDYFNEVMARRKIRLVEITIEGKWKKDNMTFSTEVVIAANTTGHLSEKAKSNALAKHFGKAKFHKNKAKFLESFKITHIMVIQELGMSADMYQDE